MPAPEARKHRHASATNRRLKEIMPDDPRWEVVFQIAGQDDFERRQRPGIYWSDKRVLVSVPRRNGDGVPGASSSCISLTSHMMALEKA